MIPFLLNNTGGHRLTIPINGYKYISKYVDTIFKDTFPETNIMPHVVYTESSLSKIIERKGKQQQKMRQLRADELPLLPAKGLRGRADRRPLPQLANELPLIPADRSSSSNWPILPADQS